MYCCVLSWLGPSPRKENILDSYDDGIASYVLISMFYFYDSIVRGVYQGSMNDIIKKYDILMYSI